MRLYVTASAIEQYDEAETAISEKTKKRIKKGAKFVGFMVTPSVVNLGYSIYKKRKAKKAAKKSGKAKK